MDLEHRSAALPRRHPDRGSVSCAPAPVGTRGQTLPQRCSPPEALDDDQAGQTGQRKMESLVASLRSVATSHPELAKQIRTEADYFETNAERMRYLKFRRQKLFVGSGVIEAGCKTIIGTRLKQSGMFWTVRGANAIIALRCCRLSGRFEDYWEGRRR